MNSTADERSSEKKQSPWLSWEFVAILLISLAMILVALQRPTGSLAGRIALQQDGFDLYSYNMREHSVYALAIGPRGSSSDERGVWVNQDGSFQLDNLPTGEYQLKVHVPGFSTTYLDGLFVEDGQVSTMPHPVQLTLEQPSVGVHCTARVFTTKEQPRFWMNVSGCSEATAKVYRGDMLALLKSGADKKTLGFQISSDLSIYKPYDVKTSTKAQEYFSKDQPIKEWKRNTNREGYNHEEFKFDKPLSPGDYFVVGEGTNLQGKADWSIYWFTVSDIGLVIKKDPTQTLVRAIDLNTLRPMPLTKIGLYVKESPAQPIASGLTGKDGFVHLNSAAVKDGSELVVMGELAGSHAYGGMNYYGGGESNKYRTMFYTDRPVYRLGQTVYFKGITRHYASSGAKNPGSNLKVTATIEDPDNNEVWSGNIKTNAHGTFNGLFEIPADGKTGAYQVLLKYPDGSDAYERFEVAEYRKPEYQVEVTAAVPQITAGSKGKARIKATYFFGAPVANAKVKYTIYSAVDWSTRYSLMDRPEYYGYFDGWDNEEYQDSSYSGDYINEGYTVTDANGEATVEFDTKKSTFDPERPWEFDRYDHRYKVEAEVTDISRLSVIGSGSMIVTNGAFELFVKPTAYVAKVGDPLGASLRAVAYEGHKPAASLPVHVKLYRRIYDRVHYAYKGVQVYEETDVMTGPDGTAQVQFKTKPEFPTDTYEILATAKDAGGNTVADEEGVWVVSENYPYALSSEEANKEPLTVKLDKDVYKIGDTAKVMITAPVSGKEGAQAIVSIEGPKLYSYRVVEMSATAKMVEVPILDEYAPNVFVSVTFVGNKHQYYERSQMLKVSPQDHFLQLSVESDKPKYKPGEVATYTIKAQFENGKPAAATEVSLGIVDESIYSIRPDTTPDIRTYFYNKRANAVTTMCSFPEDYSGGPNKLEPRVRKDFRDTCAWLPALVTDDNGVVKTSVKLPDNLTTWRATAVGINMATDVGMVRQKVISTQDLILRLALPRFFSEGDSGLVTAVVHNYTDVPQKVDLTLGLSDQFKLDGKLQTSVTVEPDKVKRYSWPVSLVKPGEATVSCKAVGGTAADAMEMRLPVRPWGIQAFATKSGIINADDESVNLPIQLPADAALSSAKLHVYLSSSSISSLISNFSSLIDYPYGCTEQTMSKLMPSVVAIRLNQTLGVPLTAADKQKFKVVYKQSMDKLNGYQHEDGGWGWWANDTSSLYLTALVLDGYKLLQEASYPIEAERQTKGLQWLTTNTAALVKQLNDPLLVKTGTLNADKAIDLGRASYVMSRYKQKPAQPITDWAIKHFKAMTPEALAYFAMTYANTGDTQRATVFYQRMIELGNSVSSDAGSTFDWAPSDAMFKKLGRDKWWWYSYRYTDVETTALAMEAVTALEPENIDRLESIKRWIMMQQGKDGWGNTKTTSEVLRAMMQFETRLGNANADPNFSVELPGAAPGALTFNKQNRFEKERDINVPLGKDKTYTLHKQGKGRLYYTSTLTYYKQLKPNQFVAEKGMPDGLKLTRQFFRLKASAPDSNGNVKFTALPVTDNRVHAGETILMKVLIEAPTDLPYICVEAPLPSGAEVVNNDTRSDAEEEGEKKEDDIYRIGSLWWTHQDVMDDHLAYFVTDLSRGKAEINQMMRLELPGKFRMNPITIEGMYSKWVKGYSQPSEIEVYE